MKQDHTHIGNVMHACKYVCVYLPAFNIKGCEELYSDPPMVIFTDTLVFTSPHVGIGLGVMVTGV